jgi:outer membrane cobalamin receptor
MARGTGSGRQDRLRCAAIGLGAALGCPVSAWAQVELEPEQAAPVSITVKGAPAPRSASEIVVEKRVLEAAPHRNGSELLLTVPGVFIAQHGGAGEANQIFFRGFDAMHGQDMELWVGGAPVNDVSNIHGQGYADLHFLIPEVVQQIRATPGNYDPAQGDFAVAGTMRFALGYEEPGVTARASLGNFGTKRYFMAYHPESASAETFGAVEVEATDGYGSSRAARHASGIAQATYDFGHGISARALIAGYAGRYDSAGVLLLSDVETGKVDRFDTYDPKQGGFSSRAQLVLELTDRGPVDDHGRSSNWSISPFLVWRTLKLRNDYTGYLTSPEGDSIQQRNDATTFGATASYRRALRMLSERDALTAGVSVRSDGIEQSQHRLSLQNDRVTDDAAAPGIDALVRATNVAGYIDASLHPMRRVTLRGGLRLDGLAYLVEDRGGESAGQTRSSLGAQLSKRGTLDVVALPGLHVVGSYGEGFRSPQARSLGEGEPTPFTRVVSYEGGLRYGDAKRLRATLGFFHTRLSDDLAFDPTTGRNELTPSTGRTGLSINATAEPSPWLVSSTSFTYARAVFTSSSGQYTDGALVPYVPQLVVRSDLAVTPVLGHLSERDVISHFGVGATYMGRRPLPYDEMGHDVFLVDAGASVRWGPIATGIDVFNLLGASWYESELVYASAFEGAPSLVPARHVTAGAPRSFLWSLTLYI